MADLISSRSQSSSIAGQNVALSRLLVLSECRFGIEKVLVLSLELD